MDNLTKYPKTDKGRKAFIKDSLSFNDISDEHAFKVIPAKPKPDYTLIILNETAGALIFLITLPVSIPSLAFVAIKRLAMPALEKTLLWRAEYLRRKRKEIPRDKTASIIIVLFIILFSTFILAYAL